MRHLEIVLKYIGLMFFSLCLVFVCLYIRGCNGIGPNFDLHLRNGYRIVVYDEVAILNLASDWAIEPNIQKLNTDGDLVFGRVFGSFREHEGMYFILDMATGENSYHNTEDDWQERLQHLGIEDEVKLIRPSFFFNLFRGK